jgi:hypothetical protein
MRKKKGTAILQYPFQRTHEIITPRAKKKDSSLLLLHRAVKSKKHIKKNADLLLASAIPFILVFHCALCYKSALVFLKYIVHLCIFLRFFLFVVGC